MKLGISIASRDRFFGKAMRRIRPAFTELECAIEALDLSDPGFENFLIGLTDDPAADGAEVVFTDADTRQVMIGLGEYSRTETDESLLARSIAGMVEGLRLTDVEDEGDFRMLLATLEASNKSKG
ncbi:hypothetical protein [Prosthecobacter sp.]|uniref:hypothetical protein n=1 Tax=Prosthecobacter sp. TaxID=1965333 RepID=UPI001D69DBA5|nr:hypothetical protein [Prosthecobacter sp.]MCB1277821.1 hypothetical protein [Prosthecobacter sp.]